MTKLMRRQPRGESLLICRSRPNFYSRNLPLLQAVQKNNNSISHNMNCFSLFLVWHHRNKQLPKVKTNDNKLNVIESHQWTTEATTIFQLAATRFSVFASIHNFSCNISVADGIEIITRNVSRQKLTEEMLIRQYGKQQFRLLHICITKIILTALYEVYGVLITNPYCVY